MKYTVYKVTNLINNKIYVGAHKTKNLNDNYMGSGKAIKQAIKKYGKVNFVKEIIHILETEELMYAKEAEIVDINFISSPNTYNLAVGGLTGGLRIGKARMIHILTGEVEYIDVNLVPMFMSNGWVGWAKGYMRYKDIYNNEYYMKTCDPRIQQLNLAPWTKGKVVMLVNGVAQHIKCENVTSDMVSIKTGFTSVKDENGNTYNVGIDDIRYTTGELVGVNKGKVGLTKYMNSLKRTCEKCGIVVSVANYVRWHSTTCIRLPHTKTIFATVCAIDNKQHYSNNTWNRWKSLGESDKITHYVPQDLCYVHIVNC